MRCYFMRRGHIVDVEILSDLSDDEAVAKARLLFSERPTPTDGFEVWDRGRLILRHHPESTAGGGEEMAMPDTVIDTVTVIGSGSFARADGRVAIVLDTKERGVIAFVVNLQNIEKLRRELMAAETDLRQTAKNRLTNDVRGERDVGAAP